MVGKTIGRPIKEREIPVFLERFGRTKDEIFVTATALRSELGSKEFDRLPAKAIGVYTYHERLTQGLHQLMAGSRRFSLDHWSRTDIAAEAREASEASGIPHGVDIDSEEVDRILDGQPADHEAVPDRLARSRRRR